MNSVFSLQAAGHLLIPAVNLATTGYISNDDCHWVIQQLRGKVYTCWQPSCGNCICRIGCCLHNGTGVLLVELCPIGGAVSSWWNLCPIGGAFVLLMELCPLGGTCVVSGGISV